MLIVWHFTISQIWPYFEFDGRLRKAGNKELLKKTHEGTSDTLKGRVFVKLAVSQQNWLFYENLFIHVIMQEKCVILVQQPQFYDKRFHRKNFNF